MFADYRPLSLSIERRFAYVKIYEKVICHSYFVNISWKISYMALGVVYAYRTAYGVTYRVTRIASHALRRL